MPDYKERVINSMSRWQEQTVKKTAYYKPFKNVQTREELLKALRISKLLRKLKIFYMNNL